MTCGMPGHRYGSTDTEHEPSYTACINSLRGHLDEARTIMRDAADFLGSYTDDTKLAQKFPTLLVIMQGYASDLRSQLPPENGD